jgi:predicted transcriptional regulator of viral defense system
VVPKTPHRARASDATPALIRLAARQHGVVTTAQLREAGLHRSAIAREVDRGRLHRVFRGVYAVGHPGLSREGRWMAATLAVGDGAALSHGSAGALLQVRLTRTMLVDVISPRRCRISGPVRTHCSRTLVPEDITSHRGIPVTTVARLLVDLTDSSTPHQLANVIHRAHYRNRWSESLTRAAMARAHGRRNLHRLDRAIELYASGSAGTRSEYEDAFLALGHATEPLVNTPLLGEEVDFYWPGAGLVVEIDGGHHDRPPSRRDDARRDAKLAAAGLRVMRVPAGDVERRPRDVRACVAAAIARRGGRA